MPYRRRLVGEDRDTRVPAATVSRIALEDRIRCRYVAPSPEPEAQFVPAPAERMIYHVGRATHLKRCDRLKSGVRVRHRICKKHAPETDLTRRRQPGREFGPFAEKRRGLVRVEFADTHLNEHADNPPDHAPQKMRPLDCDNITTPRSSRLESLEQHERRRLHLFVSATAKLEKSCMPRNTSASAHADRSSGSLTHQTNGFANAVRLVAT